MTIGQWLKEAGKRLKEAGISSAKLDADIILSDILHKDRSWLVAHAESKLEGRTFQKAEMWCSRREKHEPLAYIRGFKEFYGRDFIVSPDVLVPRPESEAIVDMAKDCPLQPSESILDAGTGSGNLGITLKLELPGTKVNLLDVSSAALTIARQNAKALGAAVSFQEQDVMKLERTTKLKHAPYKLIVANLPYVDEVWDRSQATDFEPSLAIFSPAGGLWHYINFLAAALHFLAKDGWIIVEADPRQQDELLHYAEKLGFQLSARDDFALLLTRRRPVREVK